MRKFSVSILFVFTLMATFSSISGADEFITGRDCTVPEDTVIEGDLYAFCRSLTVDGTVTGDNRHSPGRRYRISKRTEVRRHDRKRPAH